MAKTPRIVILGCGPTGLGAAQRLHEKGYRNVRLFERNHYAGGLAASFTDASGFVWDIGGHIQFSHYDHFNTVANALMGDDLIRHVRQSYIWIGGTFIPYPLQRNLRYLPDDRLFACLRGLIRAAILDRSAPPTSYREWLTRTFGDELADLFFEPYAAKVWICPTNRMSCNWVSDRVAETNLAGIVSSITDSRDDVDWGPNATFGYPRIGGTGEMWRRLAEQLSAYIAFGRICVGIDSQQKRVHLADGSSAEYDYLISTLPLDQLMKCLQWREGMELSRALLHTSVSTFGLGMKGEAPSRLQDKMWIYFPDGAIPFYRCTIFSNLSPHNVPSGGYWSLMVESGDMIGTARSPPEYEDVVKALTDHGLIDDPDQIVAKWRYRTPYGYPIPTTDRDTILRQLLEMLESHAIYSRGRFGLWRYEVSNQDHSFMQGVEVADHLVEGSPERVAKGGLSDMKSEGSTLRPLPSLLSTSINMTKP